MENYLKFSEEKDSFGEKDSELSENIGKNFFNFQEIWEKNKILVTLILIGLILVGIGIFSLAFFQSKEPDFEIISSEKESQGRILVHLEGAVEKTGVFELPAESRLNDLLILAGGLSATADREWISQNFNLAQKLSDGAKIYIPYKNETLKTQEDSIVKVQGFTTKGKININTASFSQLDSLWGIGEKRAEDIIKNRPYQKIEELTERKIIPKNVFEKIKDEITVY